MTDILTNMRNVNSLNQPQFIINKYRQMLTTLLLNAKKKGIKAGMAFGASQFFLFAVFSVTFFAGIYYLNEGLVTFKNMFCAVFALLYAAVGSGSATQFMPDVGSAFTAVSSIFNLLDQDIMIKEDPNTSKDPIQGAIEFKNVSFIYPTRPGKVLKNVSFKVKLGQKVGLVGPSGSGKSTIIQLLLRFYDLVKGDILIDGKNIKDINLKT
jgi:ATP-binding cassette, subfamily B (MDR/TAP), member 1